MHIIEMIIIPVILQFLLCLPIILDHRYIENTSVQGIICDIQWNQHQNLTDLPPDTSCQNTKYQRVTDILNPLGLGVKVSFTILDIFGVTRTSMLIAVHWKVSHFFSMRLIVKT